VTKQRCRWCNRPFDVGEGPGRPRQYCKTSCRQRDYESRRRAAELGLNEDELIISREEVSLLKDRLFELHCALQDVEKEDDTDRAYRLLLDAAKHAVGG
jgi:hypothetical protein